MIQCRLCGREISAGPFCEFCGAQQCHGRAVGPDWLRIHHYCAAPAQHVLRPAVVSTFFPQLPRRSRPVLALTFVALLATLAALVVLRWQAPAIGVAVLGFPVLLVTYFGTSGALRDVPRRTWMLAAGLGATLGVGWALLTGAWVARSYGIGFGAGVAGGPNSTSLGVPLGAVLLMVTPAVVVRLIDSKASRSLDGFVVGVTGATSFGVAATVVRLAPQLATGLVARQRPLQGLLVEAGIRGIVIPMTSAAIGGVAGIALWFTRRPGGSGRRRSLFAAVAVVAVAVIWGAALADASGLGPLQELLLHLGVTVAALAVLRLTLQLALLHEAHGTPRPDLTIRCPECGTVRTETAFCPWCGLACSTHQLAESEPHWRPLAQVAVGLVAAAVCATVVSLLVSEPVARYACPPECGDPPTGTAVQTHPRFTAADGSFSVSYPAGESGFDITTSPSGIEAVLTRGDGGALRLFGEPARGRTPEQVVRDFLRTVRPNAKRAYVIPNAMVGYRPGYGEVDDDYPVSLNGAYVRLRLVTVAAVNEDDALIAAAIGPFHQFGPDFGPGPPSAVNLQLGLEMDQFVNSFRWRGGPAG